jgi:hypothetical protein
MFRWTCPYCGKSMYSSWDKHTDEVVICVHCDGIFKNPYYRGTEDKHEGDRKLQRK